LDGPRRYFEENTHTVSVVEMLGIQTLARVAKNIPMQSGQPERIKYEYRRHGTSCLIGTWDVVLGQMVAPTGSETRTEEGFAQHVQYIIQTDATAGWVFIVDNLNIHASELRVRYVAQLEGLDEIALGQKQKPGISKSVETRQALLADPNQRIRFVYLPQQTS
jgi:hypothetical protein